MMHDDEMLKKMLMKKKPMLTITIGQAEEPEEMEEKEDEEEKDLAPGKPFEGKETPDEEMAELMAMVGGEEDEEESDKPKTIGEMAKAKMKKRLKELKPKV